MKKFILAAATVAIALSGCSREEITNQSADRSIQFKTLEVSTRSAEKTVTNLQDGFYVYAFLKDGTDYTKEYMGKTEVKLVGSDWVYEPLKYWPQESTELLMFYAQDKDFSWNGKPGDKVTYTAPNLEGAGKDILVAKTGAINTPADKVDLNFHHALSQVKVSARSGLPSVRFVIINIELTKVKSKGEVTLLGWTPGTPSVAGSTIIDNGLSWDASALATPVDYVLGLHATNKSAVVHSTLGDYVNITADNGPLFIIPQQLVAGNNLSVVDPYNANTSNNTYLVVKYEAYDVDTDTKVIAETTTAAPIDTYLKPGICYHYRLELTGIGPDGNPVIKPIEFNPPTVQGWVEAIVDITL